MQGEIVNQLSSHSTLYALVNEEDVYYRAGVSGLTSALLLSRNKANKVTVVAKHMPGDYDIEYASPWAGANVLPLVQLTCSRDVLFPLMVIKLRDT